MRGVPYCTVSVLSRTVYAASGTVQICTVSGFKRGGTVSYFTESERLGIVTMVSKICELLMLGSEAKIDLLSVSAKFELIICFSLHND